ncbi:MAG: GTP 3',8-cyclase MoaA [Candidatus Wukongarchaeota archaeon]|nr:GTP 3',8-cyclase MoaA [Candidatus Wukongarchaeota archaeon]
MRDPYGRDVYDLRIQVTGRCNQNCIYCHSEGYSSGCARESFRDLLSMEDIRSIVEAASELGIRRVKITGGEPLLRRDLVDVVWSISSIDSIEDISMTTNATLFSDKNVEGLYEAGLKRVNVSLDSLRKEVYERITQSKNFEAAVSGLIKCTDTFSLVKINMVLLKSLNDGEILDMLDFARNHGAILQLIELVNANRGEDVFGEFSVDMDEVEWGLREKAVGYYCREMQGRPKYYFKDGGVMEVVRPMHNSVFCAKCPRIRLTWDGKLKPCLLTNDVVDVSTALKKGASKSELKMLLEACIAARKPFFSLTVV